MFDPVARVFDAWRLVARRSLAQWKLLSSVVIGVLLAAAVMAGTVVYFDALREVALRKTIDRHEITDLDILLKAERGPTNREEYDLIAAPTVEGFQRHVDWLLREQTAAVKTATFFLTTPGNQDLAGEDNARTYFAFVPDVEQHITLLEGAFPSARPLSAPGASLEMEAMIPSEAAQLFGLQVGDRLLAVPHWTDVVPYVTVAVSGIFERDDADSEFWYLDGEILQSATGASFRTVPFFVGEPAFMDVIGPAFRKMDSTYAWLLHVVPERINARNSSKALRDIETLDASLNGKLPAFRQSTALDNALREYDRRLFFSKLPMFVVLILIAVVVLYYVATLSSLAVEQRSSEVALLRSRGASSVQILAVFVLEGATIAAIAIVAGPPLAAFSISVLGFTPAFSDLTDGARLAVYISRGAYALSALGGVLSFVALIVPAVQASRIGVTRQRQLSARPTTLPAFQRYYLDVLLLLISILLFRQLTEQGSVLGTRLFGDVIVSQLLLVLPGLVLVASAMVLLRLFPVVLSISSRLLSRWLPAGLAMGVWQMARNPTHYARLSLLLILTAGLGIFASGFGATLDRSFEHRVMYASGSDIRVDGVRTASRFRGPPLPPRVPSSRPGVVQDYERIPGVETASPVLRATGSDLSKTFGANYTMLAVEPDTFLQTAWYRDDFADEPFDTLIEGLDFVEPPLGITLPDDARVIGVRLKADRAHPSIRVTARVRNALDEYTTYTLGTLSSGNWEVMETSLRFGRRQSLQRSRPLELVSLAIHETRGGGRLRPGSVVLDDVRVLSEDGTRTIVEQFDDPSRWSTLKVTGDADADLLAPGGVNWESSLVFAWAEGSPLTSRGIFHGGERTSMPVLASTSFLKTTGHAIDDEFDVSVAGHRVPVRLTNSIDMFPTITSPSRSFMVTDLNTLIRYANLGSSFRELQPNEIWISTQTSGPSRQQLVERLESDLGLSNSAVFDRAQRIDDSKVDPLVGAGWRALLFIAFSAVLILSCLGFLVHAYVSFKNRELQFALLRTVGFSMRQLITMVWLEQILVIAAGMALGTWMGGRLGATIMPFLGHDDFGSEVVPPFVMEVNWGALVLIYAAMAIVFALIILALLWFIQRISLQRILRIGEL